MNMAVNSFDVIVAGAGNAVFRAAVAGAKR